MYSTSFLLSTAVGRRRVHTASSRGSLAVFDIETVIWYRNIQNFQFQNITPNELSFVNRGRLWLSTVPAKRIQLTQWSLVPGNSEKSARSILSDGGRPKNGRQCWPLTTEDWRCNAALSTIDLPYALSPEPLSSSAELSMRPLIDWRKASDGWMACRS